MAYPSLPSVIICFLLVLKMGTIEGVNLSRKLRQDDERSNGNGTNRDEEAEAPENSIAAEQTGYVTDETFYCTDELEVTAHYEPVL
eukprot:g402.t1